MKKVPPLTRLARLIEVRQRDVRSNQIRLHNKRLDLDRQLARLINYRQEYVRMLMEGNISPLQIDDVQRFLQTLETSIADTQTALSDQFLSEQALQEIAITLKSQQKSVARRIDLAAGNAPLSEDSAQAGLPQPFARGNRSR